MADVTIESGDNVKLKGQDVVMTVIRIGEWETICGWHDINFKYHEAVFPLRRQQGGTPLPAYFVKVSL